VRDLSSDDGHPVTDLEHDPVCLSALEDASGQFVAAVLVARQYSPDDLVALTGNSLALRKRIVCDLAMVNLIARRPEKVGQQEFDAARQRAEAYLDRLRKGDRVFDVAGCLDAGLPKVDGPTSVTVENLNLITTRTKRFYPNCGGRLPLGRSF
jgi:hypothetical protein